MEALNSGGPSGALRRVAGLAWGCASLRVAGPRLGAGGPSGAIHIQSCCSRRGFPQSVCEMSRWGMAFERGMGILPMRRHLLDSPLHTGETPVPPFSRTLSEIGSGPPRMGLPAIKGSASHLATPEDEALHQVFRAKKFLFYRLRLREDGAYRSHSQDHD